MKNGRDLSFHYLLRGIILIGFMLLLFKLLLTNNISLLIAPKMLHFIYFTLFVLLTLGVLLTIRGTAGQNHSYHCDCEGEHSYPKSISKSVFLYVLFIFPIITGFLFSSNVLGSSVALNRTIKLGANSQETNQIKNVSTTTKSNSSSVASSPANLLDNQPDPLTQSEYTQLKDKMVQAKNLTITDDQYVPMMNIIQDNLPNMIGKSVTTKGFVYREKDFMQNQIIVARFGITCCVADASVYGMMTTGDVVDLQKDEWVEVTGTIEKTQYDGSSIPMLKINQISKITAPKQPYVFDVGIKIE
ncbi:MAG: TIGR03943 family protein [Bacillus sp. (in: firmicutes)]